MTLLAKKIFLGLACLLIVMAFSAWEMPSRAQSSFPRLDSRFSLTQPSFRTFASGDIEFTSVHLDGQSLFQVASQKASPSELEPEGSLSPLERRVQLIESRLRKIVNAGFDPKTLEVGPAILNGLTVIIASDQKNLNRQVILTVTEIDAQIASASIADVAEQWSQTIRQSLIQAQQARQPEARKEQLAMAGIIILGILSFTLLLIWYQKRLKKYFKYLTKRVEEQSSLAVNSKELFSFDKSVHSFSESVGILNLFHERANLQKQLTLNILLQRLDQIGLVLLWVGGIATILFVFPETRLESFYLIFIPIKIFIIWFSLTLFNNFTSLYINYRLREWVEEGAVVSEAYQRRIVRASTLLVVSQGIIRFASWCLGIIWFLAWKGVLPNSLLAGAGILGAALTFAFQNLLRDWINGILIIFEDQYAVGDIIVFDDLIGIVENMSLRVTQIRTLDGRLTTIPHNQMLIAHNLSKDWSRVNFIIEVAYETDVMAIIALMKQVSQDMAMDAQWQEDIIEPVSLIGVNRVTHSGIEIMMWIQVKRLRQLFVEQEFRRRLKIAFDEQGIRIGIPKQSLLFQFQEERLK